MVPCHGNNRNYDSAKEGRSIAVPLNDVIRAVEY